MSSFSRQITAAFLSTQPLWTRQQFGIEQFIFPEINLEEVQEFPIPSRMRLGHKMELVFNAAMEKQSSYELIERNIVIQRGNRTLGELDFLLRDTSDNSLIHLELTYKFYLIDNEISEPIYRLVGPNRRDMFYT
ncbi:MAG: DUF1853 family protein, partial [Flavobacteriaceae bacterium]|nr:DUF1853 family protein [Flavobacteriaceae bacterium]